MKRILTLLFLFAGLTFAMTASAQTDGGKKKKDKKSEQKADQSSQKAGDNSGGAGGGGGITIDEGGAPKAKGKGTTTNGGTGNGTGTSTDTPKDKDQQPGGQSAEKTGSSDDAPAPDIAIDEGGAGKVKGNKSTTTLEATPSPTSSDSAAKGPLELIKPE